MHTSNGEIIQISELIDKIKFKKVTNFEDRSHSSNFKLDNQDNKYFVIKVNIKFIAINKVTKNNSKGIE